MIETTKSNLPSGNGCKTKPPLSLEMAPIEVLLKKILADAIGNLESFDRMVPSNIFCAFENTPQSINPNSKIVAFIYNPNNPLFNNCSILILSLLGANNEILCALPP